MAKLWYLPTKILIQKLVLGRRVEPLLTTDNMRDVHEVVVHYIGKMVGGHTVRFQKNLGVDHAPVQLDITPQPILYNTSSRLVGNSQTDDKGCTRTLSSGLLFSG